MMTSSQEHEFAVLNDQVTRRQELIGEILTLLSNRPTPNCLSRSFYDITKIAAICTPTTPSLRTDSD